MMEISIRIRSWGFFWLPCVLVCTLAKVTLAWDQLALGLENHIPVHSCRCRRGLDVFDGFWKSLQYAHIICVGMLALLCFFLSQQQYWTSSHCLKLRELDYAQVYHSCWVHPIPFLNFQQKTTMQAFLCAVWNRGRSDQVFCRFLEKNPTPEG